MTLSHQTEINKRIFKKMSKNLGAEKYNNGHEKFPRGASQI